MKKKSKSEQRPKQHQDRQPGIEAEMRPLPRAERSEYRGSEKLKNKVALITGGDSGIGRAVAIAFAKEGADLALGYLKEEQDAQETRKRIEKIGRRCLLLAGDLASEEECKRVVARAFQVYEKVHVLVNNAAEQHPRDSIEEITSAQLERTFQTNIFSFFHITKAVLQRMGPGDAIINTTSVTAYRGSSHLIDYAATKGAIVAFTRSLSQSLIHRGIRVNGVAPGPVWTPLIPSTFSARETAEFGSDVPMERAAEPEEIAPSYVFLAGDDASYMTGQVLHPNGGEIING